VALGSCFLHFHFLFETKLCIIWFRIKRLGTIFVDILPCLLEHVKWNLRAMPRYDLRSVRFYRAANSSAICMASFRTEKTISGSQEN
jgi:hypothetical protein